MVEESSRGCFWHCFSVLGVLVGWGGLVLGLGLFDATQIKTAMLEIL